MSLLSDVTFMLRRSSESNVKISGVLRTLAKSIRKNGDAAVYKGFSDRVKYNLCCARILQRNLSDWNGWEWRDEWAAAMRFGQKTIPFWDGGYVEKLIIIGEQGVGDEVMFASVIPEAMIRCKEVTYLCDERLIPIVERSFRIKTMPRYAEYDNALDGFDAYIPVGDLFPMFRRREGDFPRKPFMKIDQKRVAEFEKYRGRIGVSWKGRHGYIDPLELGIKNPISLQYNEQHPDIETPDIDLKNDLDGVFTLCSVLDKVVCVPTSVMHFAGSIGVPAEIIIAPPETEEEVDKVVDQLDYHVPVGGSMFYRDSYVYRNINEWKSRKQAVHS